MWCGGSTTYLDFFSGDGMLDRSKTMETPDSRCGCYFLRKIGLFGVTRNGLTLVVQSTSAKDVLKVR